MWRQKIPTHEPNKTSWIAMVREINSWMKLCEGNPISYAAACYLCHRMKELNKNKGMEYSKELGSACAVYCLKLYNDIHVKTNEIIARHNNRIVVKYEEMITNYILKGEICFGNTFFNIIGKRIDPDIMSEERRIILGDLIIKRVSENVWSDDQEFIANDCIRISKEESKFMRKIIRRTKTI